MEAGGLTIADSERALRVLETSQAPAIYLPLADVAGEHLLPNPRHTLCEWKGRASYYDVVVDGYSSEAAAWYYPEPDPRYEALRKHVAFYPQRVDLCLLGEERVEPNQGDFYGGWITSWSQGPFKGGAGSSGW